ncbi:unnamed protein product [Gongylonema pulchrum]|uniref:Bromo domain-containing protein n=1 Tax=Gongylonema pulchrum TaxID=637853 RepID=A0A183EDT9_9BILA|nr:unnamed protein product [Gongylonema pulchrum]
MFQDMKAAELNRIDVNVEKYMDRIWELAHSEEYQKMDKSLLKDAIKRDSKEQFNEVTMPPLSDDPDGHCGFTELKSHKPNTERLKSRLYHIRLTDAIMRFCANLANR